MIKEKRPSQEHEMMSQRLAMNKYISHCQRLLRTGNYVYRIFVYLEVMTYHLNTCITYTSYHLNRDEEQEKNRL